MANGITKEAIEREIADVSDRLESVRTEAERLERILANLLELLQDKFGEVILTPAPLFANLPRVSQPRRFGQLSIRQSVNIVLKEAAKPLSVREILHSIESRGKHIRARAKSETIRAILRRSREFSKTPEGRWIRAAQREVDGITTG